MSDKLQFIARSSGFLIALEGLKVTGDKLKETLIKYVRVN